MHHFVAAWGLLALLFTSANGQCEPCDLSDIPEGYERISYPASNEHVVNPSRGFVDFFNTSASNFVPLTVSALDNFRAKDGLALAWRLYVIDAYVESDITDSFIDLVHADMQVFRDAKQSAVVRFMYTSYLTDSAPYGDADKEWMLRHIEQLRPIFFDNSDVIDVVQAGLIGTWGEWYYTTHFGDPDYLDWSDPDNVRGLTQENWQDRADILNAMLDNTPANIQVQVRVPQYKQMIHQDWTPTTQQEMEQRTHKARTGHYNDCFLASDDDMGTYINKSAEYPYMADDNLYTWMGGETCRISSEPDRHRCPTAVKEMTELHFSFLNQAYNREVLETWIEDGCYDEIHRNMGYRLHLTEAVFPSEPLESGAKLCFRLELTNNGYAAPYRERTIAILLRNKDSGQLYTADLTGYDVRTWLPGVTVVVEDAVSIPDDIIPGEYETLLAIKHDSLQQHSDYNILLPNVGVPLYSEGLNRLFEIGITTGSDVSGQGCPVLQQTSGQEPSIYDRLYCGFGGCDHEGPCIPHYIPNPSFETDEAWQGYGDGFVYTSEIASDGLRSARVENGGVYQVWSVPTGTRSFQLTADSSNAGITGSASNDYSVYCDVKFSDDSWSYGNAEPFDADSTAWHTVSLVVNAEQDIQEVWCYGMFRNYDNNVAFFDNFRMWTGIEELTDTCNG